MSKRYRPMDVLDYLDEMDPDRSDEDRKTDMERGCTREPMPYDYQDSKRSRVPNGGRSF